jgi:hypothetical protein
MSEMIEVALMKWRNRELDTEVILPTKRDVRIGQNIFSVIEESREWVPASRVDRYGRLMTA